MVAHEVCNSMAQTTVPVYLSGKLGSMVYTGNRQGTAVRMLVTPKNPETAGQTAQRQRFSAAAKAWAAISNAAQLAWKTYAATLANNLSSFNAFVRVNITAQLVGTTPPTLPPGSVSIAPVSFSGSPPLTATVTTGGAVALTVTPVASPAPDYYIYRASGEKSAGVSATPQMEILLVTAGSSPATASALGTASQAMVWTGLPSRQPKRRPVCRTLAPDLTVDRV